MSFRENGFSYKLAKETCGHSVRVNIVNLCGFQAKCAGRRIRIKKFCIPNPQSIEASIVGCVDILVFFLKNIDFNIGV